MQKFIHRFIAILPTMAKKVEMGWAWWHISTWEAKVGEA
jgi:hypothetical protein